MEQQISEIIEHMAKSHEELARALEAGRDMAVHLSYLIEVIPDAGMNMPDTGREAITGHAVSIAADVTTYLGTIAELQDALAENLSPVLQELKGDSSEE